MCGEIFLRIFAALLMLDRIRIRPLTRSFNMCLTINRDSYKPSATENSKRPEGCSVELEFELTNEISYSELNQNLISRFEHTYTLKRYHLNSKSIKYLP